MNSVPLSRPLTAWTGARAALVVGTVLTLGCVLVLPPFYLAPAVGLLVIAAVVLRHPVSGFCVLAFAVPWMGGVSVPVSGFPVTLTEVVVALLAAAFVVHWAEGRLAALGTAHWLPYLAIFVAAIALSALGAVDWHASLREITKWVEVGVIYVTAIAFVRTTRQIEWVIAALVTAGVTQALYGFAQLGLSLGPSAFARVGGLLRAYGTFDQPNPYAGYLNLVLPLAIAMAIVLPGGRRRLYGTAAVLLTGALLASESRGALLAFLVALAVMLAAHEALWRRAAGLGALFATIFALAANFAIVPLGPVQKLLTAIGLGDVSFENVNDTNFSAVERAAHWLAGVRMFAAHPLLGVGIGNYDAAYPAYHPRGWYASLQHAHDYYINIAAEAGIVGLTAYVLLAGSALWYSYAAMRQARGRVYYAVGLGVLGTLITVGVHNIFDVLYVHGLTALLGLMIALVSVALRDGTAYGAPAGAGASVDGTR